MFCSASTPWRSGFEGRPTGPFPRRSAEIAAIVLGFVFVWPAALAYVIWKIAGYPLPRDWRASIESLFGGRVSFAGMSGGFGAGRFAREGAGLSGNWAFEEYRRAEIERLEKERRRLEEESREFSRFVEELRRAKDREEFDAFMRRRRSGEGDHGPTIDA